MNFVQYFEWNGTVYTYPLLYDPLSGLGYQFVANASQPDTNLLRITQETNERPTNLANRRPITQRILNRSLVETDE